MGKEAWLSRPESAALSHDAQLAVGATCGGLEGWFGTRRDLGGQTWVPQELQLSSSPASPVLLLLSGGEGRRGEAVGGTPLFSSPDATH